MLHLLQSMLLATALGQAPIEPSWLASVPADVEIVVHIKSLNAGTSDFLKMVGAMSPKSVATVKPFIDQGLEQAATRFTKAATANSIVMLFRLPNPDGDGQPPYAIFVQSDDYAAVQRSVAGNDDVKAQALAGYDAFEATGGEKVFTFKGKGFVAFGPDEPLIAAIAQPAKSLAGALSDSLRQQLLQGDLGLYVNVRAIERQYRDELNDARQGLRATLEQSGGDVSSTGIAQALLDGAFGALQVTESWAMSFDFDTVGLTLGGELTVKPDSELAKHLATPHAGPATSIANLPAEAASFVYLNISPDTLAALDQLDSALILGTGDAAAPELRKALDLRRQRDTGERVKATAIKHAMSNVTLSTPADPTAAVAAYTAVMKALSGGAGVIASGAVDLAAERYRGFVWNRASLQLNLAKLARPGAPGGEESVRKSLGAGAISTWYGTDGKSVITVTAADWNTAKAQIDTVLGGAGRIGQTVGFAAVRERLPKQVSALFLLSAQGFVKQAIAQIGAQLPASAPQPGDLPKELAFMGAALVETPRGYEYQVFIPSTVGPVLEKGLAPLLQQVQGVVDR